VAKFVHYHWLEKQLEELQEQVPVLKNRILNRAEMVARQLAAETSGIMHTPLWTADQFPFISGVINRIRDLLQQYRQQVDDTLADTWKRLDSVQETLDGLEYFRRIFKGFVEYVALEVQEFPVCAFPDIRLTGSDFLKHDRATGTLYVTNRRLVFIATTGTLRKRESVVFDYPLPYLAGIEIDGRIKKRVIFQMQQGEIRISCSEDTQRVLSDYLEIARNFSKYAQPDMQRCRQLQRFDGDSSDVRIRILDLIDDLLSRERRRRISMARSDISGSAYGAPHMPLSHAAGIGHPQHAAQYTPIAHPSEMDIYIPHGLSSQPSRDSTWADPSSGFRTPSQYEQLYDDIKREIQATVQALRRGRLTPDEFVRRYRDLMRDSFEVQQAMKNRARGPWFDDRVSRAYY